MTIAPSVVESPQPSLSFFNYEQLPFQGDDIKSNCSPSLVDDSEFLSVSKIKYLQLPWEVNQPD